MASTKPDMAKLMAHEEELFLEYYEEVIRDLTEEDYKSFESLKIGEFFEKSLRYNIPKGRKRRAMFIIFIYRYYKKQLTEKEVQMTRIVAWCIELLQGCFLVADDIMDKSITRRGQKCWCRVTRLPLHAFNDVYHLEACVFDILERHLKDEDYYVDLVIVFRKIISLTLGGQHLDLMYACPSTVDFTHFNRKTYNKVAKYKTSLYTFYLPAALAMTMAGVKDKADHDEALVLLLKMGEYFQIQDDFMDCFGDPEVIGKIGTDIQDNKCNWLIVTALEDCSPEQRKVLEENYGSWEEERVKIVKDIYRDLDIEGKFRRYEESTYHEMCDLIKAMNPRKLPTTIFKVFLDSLFQRKH